MVKSDYEEQRVINNFQVRRWSLLQSGHTCTAAILAQWPHLHSSHTCIAAITA